jgi:hypothetical protein
MIPKLRKEKSKRCRRQRLQQHINRTHYEDLETSRFSFMQDLNLHRNITKSYSDEKFGETRHGITANSKICTTASQEEREEKKYLISSSSLSLNDSNDIHLPNFHYFNDLRPYLPSCFRLKRIACPSFLQIVYTSITLFHLLSCSNHGMFVLCFQEELYSRGNQGDILSKAVHLQQPFPEYHDDYNTFLDDSEREISEDRINNDVQFDENKNFLGCLYANDVCTQDEICFDDLILGRCVSVNSEIDDNEGLQPLSA